MQSKENVEQFVRVAAVERARQNDRPIRAGGDGAQCRALRGIALKFGSSGESVGDLRGSALGLSEEAVELPTGGVEGTLLVFPTIVDQRPAVLVDHVTDQFGG